MADTPTSDSPLTRGVIAVLEPLLGRFTSRKAVQLAVEQCGTSLEALDARSVECVCARLRPVLRTLLGAPTAGRLLEQITRHAGLQEVEP